MKRSLLLNLVLLVVVLGLGLLVYFEPGVEGEPPAEPLSLLSAGQVAEIRLQPRGQEAVVLQRRGEQWSIVEPVAVAASPFQVSRLFELLGAPSVKAYDAAGLSLAQYGLAPPEVVVRVDGQSFSFGSLSPVDYRRYVLTAGRLHLIDTTDLSLLSGDWVELVDLQLLPRQASIEALELPGLGVVALEGGRWRLQGAESGSVDADALVGLVERWRRLQAFKVSPYAMDDGAPERVVVALQGGESLTFQLERGDGEWLLGRQALGIQYHLDAAQGQRLFTLTAGE